ncbi:PREDICTED: uncharacterized protein LOC105560092 [Vollenhovia emeryi]|uniref:uncharacterized protein LOC105560092 n=1 Tax=Vollenhovia emeryi TaxID=411798 RepID=UPI0005F56054|nr:PREDICTED: uncharacterized protein LOC105560092 [Vollenhovia emeryi]
MIRVYSWIILFTLGVFAQETIYRSVSSSLKECYESKYLLEKDNRLPHTLNTLITILQKIEKTETQLNMELGALTIGIMHRFRQDGIVKNPHVIEQSGVLPYRAAGQAQKYVVIARFIPEERGHLPYNILTDIERCTLHFMLSSSIEIYERGDENIVCKYADNAYRNTRSVMSSIYSNTNLDVDDDVETLTPEQIDVITNNKNGINENVFHPNALYPELPPNHPKIARLRHESSISKCPVENGVIKTNWGPVSAGPLIAGIAAGLQSQTVKLSDVFPDEENEERKGNLSKLFLDNKWMATVAGDLAEVTLMQGPTNEIGVGVNGMWNSSSLPRWYFLKSNEKLEFTTAEIRGDIDGLILASEIEALYSKVPSLRLSQILDQYYSPRGLFNPSIRACNRKKLFQTIIPKTIMTEQAYSASLILEEYLHRATINDKRMQEFATEATEQLSRYVDSMKDLTCQETETGYFNDVIQVAVSLTIILDTTWPFSEIQPIIADILDNIKINQYNSQFKIINGRDGSIVLNTTDSILDFGYYNKTHYTDATSGGLAKFDLPKSLEKLRILQTEKLNVEREGRGQAKSDVVLIMPYTSALSNSDKDYCIEQIKQMREKVPDATLLILTYGSKDRWTDLVLDPSRDLFSTTAGDIGSSITIANLISRIKQVPQRLINTQCGADYTSTGPSNAFTDYIEPATIVTYRMHPNYFFSSDSSHFSKIKIKGSGWGNLKVCTSRQVININATSNLPADTCRSINNDEYAVDVSCGDAGFIHLCNPLYLTIIANASVTNYNCVDPKVCRFAHMIEYTVSYENLVCENSASINILNMLVLIPSMIYIFL